MPFDPTIKRTEGSITLPTGETFKVNHPPTHSPTHLPTYLFHPPPTPTYSSAFQPPSLPLQSPQQLIPTASISSLFPSTHPPTHPPTHSLLPLQVSKGAPHIILHLLDQDKHKDVIAACEKDVVALGERGTYPPTHPLTHLPVEPPRSPLSNHPTLACSSAFEPPHSPLPTQLIHTPLPPYICI